MPQMTPYLRTQLSTLSTFWVLAPELLFPAENGTSTSISCMTAGERGQEHEQQEETGTWLWIPTLTKRRCSPTRETSRGCSETWSGCAGSAHTTLPVGIPTGTEHPWGFGAGHKPSPVSLGRISWQTRLRLHFTTDQLPDPSLGPRTTGTAVYPLFLVC